MAALDAAGAGAGASADADVEASKGVVCGSEGGMERCDEV